MSISDSQTLRILRGLKEAALGFVTPRLEKCPWIKDVLGDSEGTVGHVCRFIEQRAPMLCLLTGAQESSRPRTEVPVSCVLCPTGSRSCHGSALHVAQRSRGVSEEAWRAAESLFALTELEETWREGVSWAQRGLPNSHPPGPCGWTAEGQWNEACHWVPYREHLRDRYQLLITLAPRTYMWTSIMGGTGSEIARQHVSTTQGNRKTMAKLRELEKKHFKVASVIYLNIYPEIGAHYTGKNPRQMSPVCD